MTTTGALIADAPQGCEQIERPCDLVRDAGDERVIVVCAVGVRQHVPGICLDLEVRRRAAGRERGAEQRSDRVTRRREPGDVVAVDRHMKMDAPRRCRIEIGERLGQVHRATPRAAHLVQETWLVECDQPLSRALQIGAGGDERARESGSSRSVRQPTASAAKAAAGSSSTTAA